MSYARAPSSLSACCSGCARGASCAGSGLGDIEVPVTHTHLDSSSGFLSQINGYIRNKGIFVARVDGSPSDAKTTIRFQKPLMSPVAIGAVAAAVAIGYFFGRRR